MEQSERTNETVVRTCTCVGEFSRRSKMVSSFKKKGTNLQVGGAACVLRAPTMVAVLRARRTPALKYARRYDAQNYAFYFLKARSALH